MKDKKDLYINLLTISKKIGLPVKKITDFLFLLKGGKPIENNELIKRLGISRNVLNQVKESLSFLFLPVTENTQIANSQIISIESIFENNYRLEESILDIEIATSFEELLQKRMEPVRKYDQFTATPETVSRRVNLLNFLGDIRGKRILFLGDDDFTSVLTAGLDISKRIVVLDIDSRILNSINDISAENNFNIEIFEHDLKNPLPKEMVGKFDVVFTDPPYTPEGINVFTSRAIDALDKNNLTARIYFCYGNSDRAKERFLPIYEIVVQSGLMVRYVFDKFNRYTGAESIGSSSSLFITEVTPKTKAVIKGEYEKPIYTNN